MRRRTIYFLAITILFFSANLLIAHIASQTKPFNIGQIYQAITSIKERRITEKKIIDDIRKRKVDFPLTKEIEALLRKEGASDELIEVIRQNFKTDLPTIPQEPISTATPLPTPVAQDIKEPFVNTFGMEFIYIPSGSFDMGSEDGFPDEKPVHRVTISKGFYIGKYEVTQQEYEKVMKTTPSNAPYKARLPVEMINWEDMQEFIRRLNEKNEGRYRLPTEAEWEYAARAGTNTKWSFGDDESLLGFYAWHYGNAEGRTHEVGKLRPNRYGLYDMHGNVWEACQDWYAENYYTKNAVIDPTGPKTGTERVYRGGSVFFNPGKSRSANRRYYDPTARYPNVGLRLVVE